jgi:MFS family permease
MARLGVGVSEACIVPVAMSLIGDYFSAPRMGRAQSIFYIGVQLGGGVSLLAGGLVIAFAADLRNHIAAMAGLATWQMSFIVIGLPGLLFSAFLFTLREPQRQASLVDSAPDRKMTMAEVWAILWARRHFYGRIYLAIGMIGIVQLGMPSWFPSFLIRTHGMSAADTGYQLGTLAIGFGTVGTLLGPFLAQWLERRGHADAQLRVSALSTIGMLASCVAIPIAPGTTGALAAAAGVFFSCGLPLGIIAAATQSVTPSRMRGVVAALYTFIAQLIGYMIGPTLIALCTDRVFGDPTMVGYSMQIVMGSASCAAILLLFSCLKYYRQLVGGGQAGTAVRDADAAGEVVR